MLEMRTITPEEFDTDPYLVNCNNGTLDLRLGTLRDHRPEDLITKLAPVDYEAGATDSIFEDFLDRFLHDLELRGFVRRALGYSLLGTGTGNVSDPLTRGRQGSVFVEAEGRQSDHLRAADRDVVPTTAYQRSDVGRWPRLVT